MSSPALSAARLRQDFDHTFTRPTPPAPPSYDDYLAIRLGAEPHALWLGEVALLAPLAGLTPCPSPCPQLLGLIGVRGALVPVYDLRALLAGAAAATPRWLVMAAARPVALAFDAFDGHLRLPRGGDAGPGRTLVGSGATARPVVALAAVLKSIEDATRPEVRPGP